jgi:hypothetical protein
MEKADATDLLSLLRSRGERLRGRGSPTAQAGLCILADSSGLPTLEEEHRLQKQQVAALFQRLSVGREPYIH